MAIQIEEVDRGRGLVGMILGLAIIGVAAYMIYKYFIEDSAEGATTGQGVTVVLPESYTNASTTPWSGVDYEQFLDDITVAASKTKITTPVVSEPIDTKDTALSPDSYLWLDSDYFNTREAIVSAEEFPESIRVPVYENEDFIEPTLVSVPVGRGKTRLIVYE